MEESDEDVNAPSDEDCEKSITKDERASLLKRGEQEQIKTKEAVDRDMLSRTFSSENMGDRSLETSGDFGKESQMKLISVKDLKKFSSSEVFEVAPEELGNDQVSIVSYGLQIIFINDYQGNFLPIFGISVSEFFFQSGKTGQKMEGNTKLASSSSFFNAPIGAWEPVIEHFEVELVYKKEADGTKDIKIILGSELNVNLTESLLETIRDAIVSIRGTKTDKESRKEERVHRAFQHSEKLRNS